MTKESKKKAAVNLFTNYMKQILEINEVPALKKLSHEIFQNQTLNKIEKSALIRAYKAKKAELYRNIITNSQSRLFKAFYFLIKKSPVPETGVVLYEVKDKLTKEEVDILFDLYERMTVNNGNSNIVNSEVTTEPVTTETEIDPF